MLEAMPHGLEKYCKSGFPLVDFLICVVIIGGGEDDVIVVFEPEYESARDIGLHPYTHAGKLIGAVAGLNQACTGVGADHSGPQGEEW